MWRLVLLLVLAASSSASAAPGPRAVLILVPGAASAPLLETLQDPAWAGFAGEGAVGNLNAAVLGDPSREAAYATLGAGRRVHWPLTAQESLALTIALHRAGKRLAYLGPGEGDSTLRPGLLVTGDADPRLERVVLSSQPEAAGGQATALLSRADLVVVDWAYAADTIGALDLAHSLAVHVDPRRDLILLVSPDPGSPGKSGWRRLAPVFEWGVLHPGALCSATTRTPGLLANVDVAPTLLAHLGVPVPERMEGHPARVMEASVAEVAHLAAHADATRALMVPGLLFWGLLAVLSVGWGIFALLRRAGRRALVIGRVLLGFAAAFLPAILLASAVYAPGIGALAGRILFLWLTVTVLAAALARRSPYVGVLGLITGLILFDLYLNGGRMLARNLMSDFANIGARFYGIGNEYEGLLLGTTVLLPFWFEGSSHTAAETDLQRERFSSAGWWIAVPLWVASLVAVGAPTLGADFGGAVALGIAFAAAGFLAAGKKPGWRELAAVALLLALLVAAFVWLDLSRPPGSRSHVGELAARTLREGFDPLWEIISRKILLNLRTAASPYFLGGVAAVTPLLWLWYHRQGREAGEALAARPLLKRGVQAALIGGLAVLLLNDTGVVAWAFASGAAVVFCVDVLLAERLEVLAANARK